jgi:tRNA A-37 threonylcarbamoyl transferase component Bud32
MKIGPFEILSTIGGGANGIVYRAVRSTLPDRVVAVKQLRQQAREGDREFERFHREAKLMSAIRSDYVVQLLTYEVVDGLPLLEMEYLEGGGLQAVMRDGALPVAAALHVARDILTGLSALHEKGIFHRDIKPANVLQDEMGRFKIADLGVSIGYAEAGDTVVAGTIKYVAPECMQHPPRFDGRSDLYSTGMVIYEAILGADGFKEAFPGLTPVDVLGAKWLEWLASSSDEPPALHSLRPEVAVPVSQFVARLMAKDPDRRYVSAAAALEALHPLLQIEPHEAEQVAERLRRSAKARVAGSAAAMDPQPTIVDFRRTPPPAPPARSRGRARSTMGMAAAGLVLAVIAIGVGANLRPSAGTRTAAAPPAGLAPSGAPAGQVEAMVVDEMNAPLAGVALRLRPGAVAGASGQDGRALFNAMVPGSYELTATRDGYSVVVRRVDVKASAKASALITLRGTGGATPHVDPTPAPLPAPPPPVAVSIGKPVSPAQDPRPSPGPATPGSDPAKTAVNNTGVAPKPQPPAPKPVAPAAAGAPSAAPDLSKALRETIAARLRQRGSTVGAFDVSLEVAFRPSGFLTQSTSADYVAVVSTATGRQLFRGTLLGFSELALRSEAVDRAADDVAAYLSTTVNGR